LPNNIIPFYQHGSVYTNIDIKGEKQGLPITCRYQLFTGKYASTLTNKIKSKRPHKMQKSSEPFTSTQNMINPDG
jgi:hypothetical protein